MSVSWTIHATEVLPYQNFSVDPLTALSKETELRVSQLIKDLSCVKDRSVLDIGCAAGLASIVALERGAASVSAVDVDGRFLPNIRNWAAGAGHNVEVQQKGFLELDESFRRDVVLMLEVYHWLAHQGVQPGEIADRLDKLSSSIIIIESPFDGKDPSIIRAMKGRANEYRLDIVLDRLVKMGWRVNFLGLIDYFPAEYNRARFLVEKL